MAQDKSSASSPIIEDLPESSPEILPKPSMATNPQASSGSREESPSKILLETYLPLGCLKVKLLDSQHAVNSHEWSESLDFLPHVQGATTLNTALTTLWRVQWLRVCRSSSLAEQDAELWRLYILPDVRSISHEKDVANNVIG